MVKRWYSNIAELLGMHRLLIAMRNNAGENSSQENQDFVGSKGIQNHFSTACGQWQNGPAESTIQVYSIRLITRTVMAESRLGGRYWFKAATAGLEASNAIFKALIGTMQHHTAPSYVGFLDSKRYGAEPGFT
jgi:hypothetical protein